MKIYLADQTNRFKHHLETLKLKKVMAYNKAQLNEKVTTVNVKSTKNFDQLNFDFLFDYQIFPENIMAYKTQWCDENREMKIGDSIVQQVYIPPVKAISQKIIFGVRIKEIITQQYKIGFSYETLEGHVEKGISTFIIEQDGINLICKIHTFSSPGNLLTKLLGPVFSIPYQAYCTKAALNNMKRQIEKQ